jgi:thiamine-monophosphate kinase
VVPGEKPDSANGLGVAFLSLPSQIRHFDSGGPTLAQAGEEEVLRLVAAIAGESSAQSLVRGPGDDAAVWRPEPGVEVAVTQDALVEDRDFRRRWITPRSLGRRALHVALSDVAAMGATPAWCTATVCAPGSTNLEDVLEIQRGLVAAAAAAGCAVAGGDLSDTPGGIVIDVAAGGTALPGHWLRRGAGRPGEALAVTGSLGAAAAGLAALRLAEFSGLGGNPDDSLSEELLRWVAAFRTPVARLEEGRRLAEAGVRCAGDISDGLLVESARTAAASGCGAELWRDRVPVPRGLPEQFPGEWLGFALGGGEDFELLFSAPPALLGELAAAWPDGLAPLHVVGRLAEGTGVMLLDHENGSPVTPPQVRSRHWG